MKAALTIAVAVGLLSTPGWAGEGRWTSGYGQGINEATVSNAAFTLYISCPDAALNQAPSLTLEPRDLHGGAAGPVAGLIAVDGRNTAVTFQRKVLDQNQVIFDWEAGPMPLRRALGALIGRLERGRSVTVSIPGQSLRQTFTLAGSREALAGCHD